MCPISYILDIHSLHVSSCLATTCRLVLCDLLSSKSCHTNTILLSYTRTIDFSPLIQSDLGMQSLSKSPSEWKFPVIASSFLVLKSISLISFIVQSTIPIDVIKTGTANVLCAITLLKDESSEFHIFFIRW